MVEPWLSLSMLSLWDGRGRNHINLMAVFTENFYMSVKRFMSYFGRARLSCVTGEGRRSNLHPLKLLTRGLKFSHLTNGFFAVCRPKTRPRPVAHDNDTRGDVMLCLYVQ